jgi:hypothetical protein
MSLKIVDYELPGLTSRRRILKESYVQGHAPTYFYIGPSRHQISHSKPFCISLFWVKKGPNVMLMLCFKVVKTFSDSSWGFTHMTAIRICSLMVGHKDTLTFHYLQLMLSFINYNMQSSSLNHSYLKLTAIR